LQYQVSLFGGFKEAPCTNITHICGNKSTVLIFTFSTPEKRMKYLAIAFKREHLSYIARIQAVARYSNPLELCLDKFCTAIAPSRSVNDFAEYLSVLIILYFKKRESKPHISTGL